MTFYAITIGYFVDAIPDEAPDGFLDELNDRVIERCEVSIQLRADNSRTTKDLQAVKHCRCKALERFVPCINDWQIVAGLAIYMIGY